MATDKEIRDSINKALEDRPTWVSFIAEDSVGDTILKAEELKIDPCLLVFLQKLARELCDLLKQTLRTLLNLLATQLQFLEDLSELFNTQVNFLKALLTVPEDLLSEFDLPAQIIGDLIEIAQSCPEIQRVLASFQDFFTNPFKLQIQRFRRRIDEAVRAISDFQNKVNNLLDLKKFLNNVLVAMDQVC